jgi:(1->4)-alpha-D-glucan 1-alpha-D-glucosylmutase
VSGAKSAHAMAYLRGGDVATVVPRLTKLLRGAWEGTAIQLPQGRWMNRLTGASLQGGRNAVGDILRDFPVALMVRDEETS